jgi:phosphohistidine phosphatase
MHVNIRRNRIKVLHIVRHAAAVGRKRKRPDFDRALTKKGTRTARAIVRRLRKGGFTVDRMISSPAARALGTARIFAKELKYSVKQIELNEMFYDNADNASLLSLVQDLPANASNAFLFGHDPSFSDFAQHLIGSLNQTLPKGAVVTVGFEADSWADAGPENAQLVLFDYPMSEREKARRVKSLARDIAASIAATVKGQFQGIDPRAAERIERFIRKHHSSKKMRKVAKRVLAMAPHVRSSMPDGNGGRRHDDTAQRATGA